MKPTNWSEALQPLLDKYKSTPHPLDYKNLYELLVMVVLAAQTTDKLVNDIAPLLFKAFPNMKALSKADAESIYPFTSKVRNFRNKTKWLMEISQAIKEDKNIPVTLDALTSLPGIGRKSANVIMREAGAEAEGVVVDLHVVRVAPRLGIASGDNPTKIETQIMASIPQKDWGQIGMAISFLGREICRPTDPDCENCIVKQVCEHYREGLC